VSNAAKRGIVIFLVGLAILLGALVVEYRYLNAPSASVAEGSPVLALMRIRWVGMANSLCTCRWISASGLPRISLRGPASVASGSGPDRAYNMTLSSARTKS